MASQGKTATTMESCEGAGKTSGDAASKPAGKYNLRRKTLVVRKETEERLVSPKTPKPKSRPPPLSKYRRKTANSRERSRMQEINIAFEELQTVLPLHCLPECDPKAGLTKITTLRLAVNYIAALRGVLGEDGPSLSTSPPKTSATETSQSEESTGMTEKSNEKPETSKTEKIRAETSQPCTRFVNSQAVVPPTNNDQCLRSGSEDQEMLAEISNIQQSLPVPDVHHDLDSTGSVHFIKDYSVYNEQPVNQQSIFSQGDLDAKAFQTQLQFKTSYYKNKDSLVADEMVTKHLVNNSDLVRSKRDINFQEEKVTDATAIKHADMNVDANNNFKTFIPHQTPFHRTDPLYIDSNNRPDMDFVSAGLSWVDPAVQAISFETRCDDDAKDTDMDIDSELLVYPDIIRAVINDQFA